MICAAEAPTAGSYVPPQRLEAEARGAAAVADEAKGVELKNAAEPLRTAKAMPPVARFCAAHDVSEKRVRGTPRFQVCSGCHIECQTSYVNFTLCPACSDEQQRCVNCGAGTSRTEAATPRPAGHGSEVPATAATAAEPER